jgi:hypothetical protein
MDPRLPNQMTFHTDFDQGIGQAFLRVVVVGQTGIAFFLICARIEHNGITLFDEIEITTIIRVLLFFLSSRR